MKKLIAGLVAVVALSSAAMVGVLPATAASSLHVIGKSHSSGDFAVTSASGSKTHTNAIYVRGYGRDLSGLAIIACSKGFSVGSKSTTLSHMVSGRLYKVRLPFAGDCDATASLSGSGLIRLQILAA